MIYIGVLIVIISPPPPPESPAPPPAPVAAPPVRMERTPDMVYMDCEVCGWEGGYDTMTSAKLGMAAHTRWCKKGRGRKANLFG